MRKIICFIALTLALFGCDDLFVEDLTGIETKWIIPNEEVVYPTGNIELWWEQVEGMDRAELEIVRPNFDLPLEVVLDTIVEGSDKLLWSFTPGNYELRIKPCNNATCGDWKYVKLTVDSTVDLSSQWVILLTPADSFYTSNFQNSFSWLPLFGADHYQFSIIDQQSQTEIFRDSTSVNSFDYTFQTEGGYRWRVKAESDLFGQTNYQSRILYIDTTQPNLPVQQFPLSSSNITAGNINFQWDGSSDAHEYTLQITSDTASVFLLNTTTTTDTFSFELNATGAYYWRVNARDRAGNVSSFTEWIMFSI